MKSGSVFSHRGDVNLVFTTGGVNLVFTTDGLKGKSVVRSSRICVTLKARALALRLSFLAVCGLPDLPQLPRKRAKAIF